LSNFIW